MDHKKLWKALKEMGNAKPPDLSPENCQEVTELCMELTGLGLRKEYIKAVYDHYFI